MSIKLPLWFKQIIYSQPTCVEESSTFELLDAELTQTLGVLEKRLCSIPKRE